MTVDQLEKTETRVTAGAVITAPRYESVWARTCIETAFRESGLAVFPSGGVYYGQCMQMMLEQLVEQDVQYAITADFDSIFTAAHIDRLISIIVQEDDIDAIAALQPMRNSGRVLGSIDAESHFMWDGYPIKVRTAHFGLTVIDLVKLKDVSKPWFYAEPDQNGTWRSDKIDDDVWFWRQWEKAGHSIYLDPGSRLGHLEEMIAVFEPSNDEMKVVHVYPKRWAEYKESTVDA